MVVVWWLTCLIWSTVWLFIKIGVHDIPPFTFAALRLLLAVVVLAPIILLQRTSLPRDSADWRLVLITGFLLFSINYATVYWGSQHIPSGLVAVLQAGSPVFGLLFAHYHLAGERVTWLKTTALALGVAGVAVVFSGELRASGRMALFGSLAVVVGGICVALTYVIVAGSPTRIQPSSLMASQMLVGFIPLSMAGLVLEGNPVNFRWSSQALISLLYLVLAGSVAAFWLNYWLLKRVGPTRLLAMNIVEPLLAVLLGAAVLGEKLAPATFVGAACILISTTFLFYEKKRIASAA